MLPAVDDETIAMFEQNLSRNLYKLWNRMSSGSYFPPPVKQVEIPKAILLTLEPSIRRTLNPREAYNMVPGRNPRNGQALQERIAVKCPELCLLSSASSVPEHPSHRPAIFRYTACEVLRERRFTHANPILRATGLMKRTKMLLSRIALPSRTD